MTTRTLKIIVDQEGSAQTGLDSIIDSLGSGMSTAAGIAVGALAGITVAVVGIGVAAVDAWAQMDEGVDNFTNKTGVTGEALGVVQEQIEALSESSAGVGHDLGTVGDVLGEVTARTTGTSEEIEKLSSGILTLSRITGGDAVKSTELITRVMGDWGVEIEESDALLDKLLAASQNSGIGVDALAEKVVQFGAPLRQMGFDLDESIAMLAKWEKEGVNSDLVLGSLRIATVRFAEAQEEANKQTVGGVENMKEAEDKLSDMKEQLIIATMRQDEFTESTKDSTRAQNEMRIAELTKEIGELEAAMALGEERTITTNASTLTFAESLQQTITSIQDATTETEAISIATEAFGARAGPDMAAAILEGRLSIEDMIKVLDESSGTLDRTADATLDFADRAGLQFQRVQNSLVPLGQAVMDLADMYVLPGLTTATDAFVGWAGEVEAAYAEGGLAGVSALIQADMNTLVSDFMFWWEQVLPVQSRLAISQWTRDIEITLHQSWPDITGLTAEWGTEVWAWTTQAVADTPDNLNNLTTAIQEWADSAEGKAQINEVGRTIGQSMVDSMVAMMTNKDTVSNAITAFLTELTAAIVAFIGSIVEIGISVGAGIIQGILDEIAGVKSSDAVTAALEKTLTTTVLGFNPLLIFTPVGKTSIDGMIKGVSDNQATFDNAAKKSVGDAETQANTEATKIFPDVGRAADAGIVKGVDDGIPSIESAGRRAARAAYDAAMDELDARSPSQLFLDMGEETMAGAMAMGLVEGQQAVVNATSGLISSSTGVVFDPQGFGVPAPATVIFNYTPMISAADRFEAEEILAPFIEESMRSAGVVSSGRQQVS